MRSKDEMDFILRMAGLEFVVGLGVWIGYAHMDSGKPRDMFDCTHIHVSRDSHPTLEEYNECFDKWVKLEND